ncbi:hypothetical protein ACHAW6_000479, partial [Cyclotella cf. meneghiniana]
SGLILQKEILRRNLFILLVPLLRKERGQAYHEDTIMLNILTRQGIILWCNTWRTTNKNFQQFTWFVLDRFALISVQKLTVNHFFVKQAVLQTQGILSHMFIYTSAW